MTTPPAHELQDADWLKAVFQHSPDAIVLQGMDGVIIHANEAFCRHCAMPLASVIGTPLLDLIDESSRPKWLHDIDKLMGGEWTETDGIRFRSGNRTIPMDANVIARSLYRNQLVVILHFRNISAYQQVEQALLEVQDHWNRSFDAITDGLCILDSNGHILRANQAMTRRFSAAHGSLIGLNYRVLFGVGSDRSPLSPDQAQKLSALPFSIDKIRCALVDGWFQVIAFPLTNDQKETRGAILLVRDMTEQIATSETLKKTEGSLRQVAKMEAIGRLAGGIAHDFNNMLTSVLGYGSLVLRILPPDAPAREDVQEIIKAAERATALTRQLLNFSHDRAIETRIVDINTVIDNMRSFLRRTLGDHIQLDIRLQSGLWTVKADISRLEQIVMNLAINSRDAMPEGGQLLIETHNRQLDVAFCKTHPELKPGAYFLLEVTDTGQGIPPSVLEHIFEPFFTTKESGKGTGLGLTTVYGIVRQFEGHISCYSEIGKGTTFKIYFPRCAQPGAATEDKTPEGDLPSGRGETLLVVDDESHIVSLLKQILTELNYHVLPAKTVNQAIDLSDAHDGNLHLVITDIVMPEMNGPQMMKILREKRPSLKAIYMSGYANHFAVQISAMESKALFLQKPFTFQQLAQNIRAVLDDNESSIHASEGSA